MRMCGETLTSDVVSALAAGIAGYAATTMALNNRPKAAFWTSGILGVGGIIGKNYVSNPMCHEIFEALGYGGFFGLGSWAAAVMAKKDNIPVWRPQAAQSSVIATVPRVAYVPPPPPPPAPVSVPAPAGNWEFEY